MVGTVLKKDLETVLSTFPKLKFCKNKNLNFLKGEIDIFD